MIIDEILFTFFYNIGEGNYFLILSFIVVSMAYFIIVDDILV